MREKVGTWGTALAFALSKNDIDVTVGEEMIQKLENCS